MPHLKFSSIATTSAKMKGLKIFFLVFGFSAVQAQKLTGVTEETSEECKVRTDYTKWIAKGETLAKVDFDGKQDKPVQFEAQRGSWFNFRDAATTKVLATWKFEIPKTKDAFICFGEFHVPRKVDTTADTVECDPATEDVLLVKDGATELIKCCGTQCHAKTFKIPQNAADKTFEVTLIIASLTNYPSRWSNPEPTLEKYKLLYKDIVRFQVSASSKTQAEEDKKAAEDKATGDQAVKDTIYATAITCNKDGTIGNWKVYIYEKNTTATDEAACKAACTGADLESSKKCDFFIFKTSSCFLGDFSRGETTILADATSLGKPVDIQLKKATAALALGDGTPAYSDHKEECGLLGVMIKGVNKNEVLVDVASETECAARCALGCLHECQSFKYDADAKTCHFINWAEADLDKSYSPTGITDPTKLQTSNNLEALAEAARAALASTDKEACMAPADGSALIKADIADFDFKTTASKKCVLVVYNPDGKKITLELPKDFGGAGAAGKGIDVFVGVPGTKTSISIFKSDLRTALPAAEKVEWHAPIVTIAFESAATPFTKLEEAKITGF